MQGLILSHQQNSIANIWGYLRTIVDIDDSEFREKSSISDVTSGIQFKVRGYPLEIQVKVISRYSLAHELLACRPSEREILIKEFGQGIACISLLAMIITLLCVVAGNCCNLATLDFMGYLFVSNIIVSAISKLSEFCRKDQILTKEELNSLVNGCTEQQ